MVRIRPEDHLNPYLGCLNLSSCFFQIRGYEFELYGFCRPGRGFRSRALGKSMTASTMDTIRQALKENDTWHNYQCLREGDARIEYYTVPNTLEMEFCVLAWII